jgi:hypothetical protein
VRESSGTRRLPHGGPAQTAWVWGLWPVLRAVRRASSAAADRERSAAHATRGGRTPCVPSAALLCLLAWAAAYSTWVRPSRKKVDAPHAHPLPQARPSHSYKLIGADPVLLLTGFSLFSCRLFSRTLWDSAKSFSRLIQPIQNSQLLVEKLLKNNKK